MNWLLFHVCLQCFWFELDTSILSCTWHSEVRKSFIINIEDNVHHLGAALIFCFFFKHDIFPKLSADSMKFKIVFLIMRLVLIIKSFEPIKQKKMNLCKVYKYKVQPDLILSGIVSIFVVFKMILCLVTRRRFSFLHDVIFELMMNEVDYK